MILLSAEKLNKSFTEKKLLDDVSFYINKGDKVGVIGLNGAGKSTFLKILAKSEYPDSGNISSPSGIRISYLEQNPVFKQGLSILQIVLDDLDAQEKQTAEYEAKTILTKMGFTDLNIDTSFFSGGEKKRVALARTLLKPCEILILDEPTNHLDDQMILWLENYLNKFQGAIIMVTHDRYFLDRVTNKIVEIDNGQLYTYDGNYSLFLEIKAQREEMAIATQRKNKSIFKKELEWIRRGVRARGTKSKSRIERFEDLSEKVKANTDSNTIEMDSVTTRLGKKTIEINNISKYFDDYCIVKNFSHVLMRDARIGIIGKNGCGKSTLVKTIVGEIMPDTGSVVCGDTVKIGYLSQESHINNQTDEQIRVIDYIREIAEYVTTIDGTISASQMLERFLFSPELQWNTIKRLSGGEKRRLELLRVLMSAPNILILDEPTNDVDIETLTVLEDYLSRFNGAIIVISHDRYFLDKVVDNIFTYIGDGEWKMYNGGYTDYIEKSELELESNAPKQKKEKNISEKSKSAKLKFTYQEQKDFDTIDDEIASIEQQLEKVTSEIESNSSSYEKLVPFMEKKEQLETELALKMDRWLYLNDLAQKIEDSK